MPLTKRKSQEAREKEGKKQRKGPDQVTQLVGESARTPEG